MKTWRSFIWHFYIPLILAVFLILIILVSPKFIGEAKEIEFGAEVAVLGIKVPLPVWLDKVWILRLSLIGAAAISMAKALAVNFSEFFPRRLNMDVYFDEKGIERTLNLLTKKEQSEVSLAVDWKQRIKEYDAEVIGGLDKLWKQHRLRNMPDIEDFSREFINARGSTTFVVKRVGLLSYRIVESVGHLDYDWDVPKKHRRSFRGLFELRETASNHLRPKFLQLITHRSILLRPEFKQIFSTESGTQNAPFDHTVIGLTKIYLFPFPHYDNTLYLWRHPSGTNVPIAYSIYIHEAVE